MTDRSKRALPQFIDTRLDPTGVIFRKTVLRYIDIRQFNPGTEINTGSAKEVKIFADLPAAFRVGDSVQFSARVTEITFKGHIDKIWVRKGSASDAGRVVVFAGNPILGVDWRREDILSKAAYTLAPVGIAFGAGVITGDSAAVLIATEFEANYLVAMHIERTVGTIESVQYVESETVSSIRMMNEVFDPASNRVNFRPPFPIRLSADGVFRFGVSNEAVGSTVTFSATLVSI